MHFSSSQNTNLCRLFTSLVLCASPARANTFTVLFYPGDDCVGSVISQSITFTPGGGQEVVGPYDNAYRSVVVTQDGGFPIAACQQGYSCFGHETIVLTQSSGSNLICNELPGGFNVDKLLIDTGTLNGKIWKGRAGSAPGRRWDAFLIYWASLGTVPSSDEGFSHRVSR